MYEPTDPRRLCYEAIERAGVKIGHVVSDGYSHKRRVFWPADQPRRCRSAAVPINRERRVIEINATAQAWCGGHWPVQDIR